MHITPPLRNDIYNIWPQAYGLSNWAGKRKPTKGEEKETDIELRF